MLSQEQANEAWGHINAFITNRDGDIFQEQPWGTRRLAYPIHQGSYHFLEGNYRLIRFSTEKPFNQALENYLRMDERVLRSLVISIPDREILPDPVAARPAPAAAAAPAPTEGGEAPTAAEAAAPVEASEATAETQASTEASSETAPEATVDTETAGVAAEAAAPETEATAEVEVAAETANVTPAAEEGAPAEAAEPPAAAEAESQS
jgi:ribosomal protein S6